jgi:isochorismate pyruvate lyase
MSVERVFTNTPWEKSISYCRAIKSGPFVAISGTTSIKEGEVIAPGDAYAQTMQCLEIIDESLAKFGLDRSAVIRTRMFVTDITKWEEYGKAHGQFFRDYPPTTSMYEVSALISMDLMIEIEADAISLG